MDQSLRGGSPLYPPPSRKSLRSRIFSIYVFEVKDVFGEDGAGWKHFSERENFVNSPLRLGEFLPSYPGCKSLQLEQSFPPCFAYANKRSGCGMIERCSSASFMARPRNGGDG